MLKRGESKRCEFFAADFLIIFASCAPETNKPTSLLVLKDPFSRRQKKGKEIKSRLY